jgi:DNA-binding PadR family transcriptional regulator
MREPSVKKPPQTNFTIVPNAILDGDLSPQEVWLWTVLRRFDFHHRGSFPSQERLAKLAGVSPRTIYSWTKGLEEKGYVEVQRGQRNTYRTLPLHSGQGVTRKAAAARTQLADPTEPAVRKSRADEKSSSARNSPRRVRKRRSAPNEKPGSAEEEQGKKRVRKKRPAIRRSTQVSKVSAQRASRQGGIQRRPTSSSSWTPLQYAQYFVEAFPDTDPHSTTQMILGRLRRYESERGQPIDPRKWKLAIKEFSSRPKLQRPTGNGSRWWSFDKAQSELKNRVW